MEDRRPAFVFIHGAWHNGGTWAQVVPILKAQGCAATAIDLPGAGANAKSPEAYLARSIDPVAFATEPSPNAAVDQNQRTLAVIKQVEAHSRPVILVGHSLGGLTVASVAQAIPEKLAAQVFLSAFVMAPGAPMISMVGHPTMERSLVPSLLVADPQQVGALRINPRSEDAAYRERVKQALYADVSDDKFATALQALHCDEPAGVSATPSPITADRFGRVARHYVRCTEDRAVPLECQNHMIAEIDAALGGETHVHTLSSSHSPFYSQPQELVDIFMAIAATAATQN